MEFLTDAILIGVGATVAVDLWALLRRRLFGVALPDYALVGRWFGHMPGGRFVHAPITSSPLVAGELALGWAAHYLIGIAFAALLLVVAGPAWPRDPTLGAALAVGVATTAAPVLVMQPALGLLAGRSATQRRAARLHALATHACFGLGLYAAAWTMAWT